MARTGAGARTASSSRLTVRNFGTAVQTTGAGDNTWTNPSTRTAGQPLSASVWFKATKPAGTGQMLGVRLGGSAGALWKLEITTAGKLEFEYDPTGGGTTVIGSFVCDQQWHLGVGVYDGSAVNVYIDGALNAQSGSTFTTAAIIQTSGHFGGGNTENYIGYLDEPTVWNAALTLPQVSALYLNGIVPQTGLLSRWLLNEGSGGTANDSVGSNNITLSNASFTTDIVMKARTVAGARSSA